MKPNTFFSSTSFYCWRWCPTWNQCFQVRKGFSPFLFSLVWSGQTHLWKGCILLTLARQLWGYLLVVWFVNQIWCFRDFDFDSCVFIPEYLTDQSSTFDSICHGHILWLFWALACIKISISDKRLSINSPDTRQQRFYLLCAVWLVNLL